MNTSDAARARVFGGASGPTVSLWLRILVRCAVATGAAAVMMTAAAFLAADGGAAASVLAGWGLVALFFGISLLIGHFVGRDNPSGALGVFLITYVIKVVGFAAVLFLLGTPPWLDRVWFFSTAVATVVIWQIVEVAVFARARHQLYNDAGAGHGAPGNSGTQAVDGRG
ncbi:hypothetical protein [Arthrobacter sp. JZ12]|uniref:hypothetical protein n=1 Tax=Arthrobacter sp. JZ12 TaxID=2654190 RepID=UPI002B4A80D6|nr:hypothetical protein [Arthrobacter sp. JZ12]